MTTLQEVMLKKLNESNKLFMRFENFCREFVNESVSEGQIASNELTPSGPAKK